MRPRRTTQIEESYRERRGLPLLEPRASSTAMRPQFALLLLTTAAFAQAPGARLAADDAVRIREFYRLASQIQDQIWPDWSQTPAPLLLVTPDAEFLMHRAEPPEGFKKVGDDLYARSRQFPTNLLV